MAVKTKAKAKKAPIKRRKVNIFLERKKELLQELKQLEIIEESNKAFSKMSKANQRVAIAKDVIMTIKAKKIKISQGSYVTNDELSEEIGNYEKPVELQKLLAKVDEPCEVCAKGAMFICDIMRRNDFKVSDNTNIEDERIISKRLSQYFPQQQLDLIECAFEEGVQQDYTKTLSIRNDDGNWIYSEIAKEAMEFGERYKRSEDRLIAIMKNIIKNNGTFKP